MKYSLPIHLRQKWTGCYDNSFYLLLHFWIRQCPCFWFSPFVYQCFTWQNTCMGIYMYMGWKCWHISVCKLGTHFVWNELVVYLLSLLIIPLTVSAIYLPGWGIFEWSFDVERSLVARHTSQKVKFFGFFFFVVFMSLICVFCNLFLNSNTIEFLKTSEMYTFVKRTFCLGIRDNFIGNNYRQTYCRIAEAKQCGKITTSMRRTLLH